MEYRASSHASTRSASPENYRGTREYPRGPHSIARGESGEHRLRVPGEYPVLRVLTSSPSRCVSARVTPSSTAAVGPSDSHSAPPPRYVSRTCAPDPRNGSAESASDGACARVDRPNMRSPRVPVQLQHPYSTLEQLPSARTAAGRRPFAWRISTCREIPRHVCARTRGAF